MLDDISRAHRSRPIGTVHDKVDLGLLVAVLVDGDGGGLRTHATTIPCTSNLIPWDNLSKATSLNVPYFNEARIEEKDIGCVECNTFSSAFPLYSAHGSAGIPMFVDVQSEFCSLDKSVANEEDV